MNKVAEMFVHIFVLYCLIVCTFPLYETPWTAIGTGFVKGMVYNEWQHITLCGLEYTTGWCLAGNTMNLTGRFGAGCD